MANPLANMLGDSTVTVLVGCDQKRYNMHRGILFNSGEYFARALEPNPTEVKVLSLSLVEPEVFELFGQWIYQKSFIIDEPTPESLQHRFVQLYEFAQEYEVWDLEEEAMKVVQGFCSDDISHDDVLDLYQFSPRDSDLGEFLVAFMVWQICTSSEDICFQGSKQMMETEPNFAHAVFIGVLQVARGEELLDPRR